VDEASRRKSGPKKVRCTRVIRTRRGLQLDRFQIRVGPRKKNKLKFKATNAIKMKRGMQWNRLQIRVLKGPRLFFKLLQVYSPP
jgi:hypothetical protein